MPFQSFFSFNSQQDETLPVRKNEFLKHLCQIGYYNFNFLGAFLGAKIKFDLDDHLTLTQISWLITFIHMFFAQNCVSFICTNSTLIKETNSFFDTLFFMIIFAHYSYCCQD
jgi:hypothetical protein